MTNVHSHSKSSFFFQQSQNLLQSYLTTTRQCGAALSTIVDTSRLDADGLEAVFTNVYEKSWVMKMHHNNHNKIIQATDHSVNGKISAITINPIDDIDHGAGYRYGKLPGFHE